MKSEEIVSLAREAGAGFACETLLIDGRDAHDFIQLFANLIELCALERAAQRAEAYAYMSQNFVALAEEIRELKGEQK